jgi:hypothetical protein
MLPLTSAARCWLLGLARSAVESAGRGELYRTPQFPSDFSCGDVEELKRPRAAFVSLHKQGRLRGCVGRISVDTPLFELIPEMAQAAACEDIRFRPVAADEISDIELEISVLSPFFPIRVAEVVPGLHGLLVRQGVRRGLLLPQVASLYQWDSTRFLSEACRKAGLPADAWKRGAVVEAFLAEIIVETGPER